MQSDAKDVHIQAAKSHHETTGHTCEVSQGTRSVTFYGRRPKIVPNYDEQVIAIFD